MYVRKNKISCRPRKREGSFDISEAIVISCRVYGFIIEIDTFNCCINLFYNIISLLMTNL